MTVTNVPLKHAATINRRVLPESTDPLWSFCYVDISQVDSNGVVSVPEEPIAFNDAPSRARRIAPAGATAISTVRTYLRAIGRIPQAEEPLVLSTGFAIAEARDDVDPNYLYFACRSDQFVDEVVARSTGVSYPAINPGDLGDIPIPLPPLDEQRRIAGFLDDQTTRIDDIIRARQTQAEAVDEALSSSLHSVYAGIGDSASQRSLRSLCPFFTDGDWIEAPFITDDGIRLIQTGNVGVGEYRDQGFKFISEQTFIDLKCKSVIPGDVLISRLSPPVARACLAPDLGVPAITSVDVVIARPDESVIRADYLVGFLSTPKHLSDSDIMSRGATMQRLSRTQVGAIRVPVPDLPTQASVVAQVAEARQTLAQGKDLVTVSVAAFAEFKRSLISAAVSGEFDVSAASGRGVPA